MTRRRAMPAASIRHHTEAVLIAMPTDWSPEQAVAVFEILDELRERVWDLYGQRIQQVLREQQSTTTNPAANNIDQSDVPF